ncbi:MAG TPA: hypothetical protein PKE12_01440 [Kiritimatiellia bacterium]|nr:hypothetical protein [Kiritimatiellia bacterium]
MPADSSAPALPAWTRRDTWLLIGLSILMGLLVYRDALLPGAILFTTDDNIGAIALRERWLPAGFWRAWDDSVLAGNPAFLTFNWTNLALLLLPLKLFHSLIHALDLAIASIGFGLFLRARGLRLTAALLGCLTAFWLGSTFFLTYAGHIGKFGVVAFAGLALWLIERAAQQKSIAWGALAGAACGGMFLEQADVAVFFSLVLGPYAVFALAREHGWDWKGWLKPLLPMGVVALMVAGRAIWMATSFFAFETTDKPAETQEQIWDYCTQWSWPPEETIEWIAPGYHGWRSGEPTGPYWGRLGRSADWETTRQGFPNFKLETLYIGSIPVAFALFGLLIGLRERGKIRADVWFWAGALVVTFILGCGKFTPIYRIFFELPGISSIRGPVKFMQVTQLALGVLAAYGLHSLLASAASTSRLRRVVQGVGVLGIVLFFSSLVMGLNSGAATQRFAAMGWGQAASTIVENRAWALGHAGVLMIAAAALAWLMLHRPSQRWAWVALGLVAADQLVVSRHYVQTVPAAGYIDRNAVVDFLQPRMGPMRLFLASQGGFYNQWLSVSLPYHGIATYNVAQMRMPEDYRQFLGAMGNRMDRLWQHFSVSHIMGPAGIWPELQNNPMFRDHTAMEFAFNVFPQGAGVAVAPGTEQQRGQHVIARYTAAAPRYALVAGWEAADESTTLARLASPTHVPLERLLVPASAELPASTGSGMSGTVDVLQFESGRVTLRVTSERGGVLRAGEKFTPYWRATVNGEPVPTFRVDHIFTGLYVKPGLNTVELEHRPPTATLLLQGAGLLLALGAIPFTLRRRRD